MRDTSKVHYCGVDEAPGCAHGFVGMVIVFVVLCVGLYLAAVN